MMNSNEIIRKASESERGKIVIIVIDRFLCMCV